MSNEETPQQNVKVNCKCRRSVLALIHSTENHVADVFAANSQNASVKSEIIQAYKTSLLTNIQIDGQTIKGNESDLDTTTEFEPFDTSKEQHIQQVLMDRFDRQIINTTRLRKTGPKQTRRKIKNLIRPELKYSALVSVDTHCNEAMETDDPAVPDQISIEEVHTRLQGSVEKCCYLKQHCNDMLQKSKAFSQAMRIFKQSENSEVVKALYETPPSTPTTSSDRHTLNKDLEATKKMSKKLLH